MTNEREKVEIPAPDGTHKAYIKNINHKDNMIIFDVEIIGGMNDGAMFHFSLDRSDNSKNKLIFDTLNVLANCAGLKVLSFPYQELVGTKFYITVKSSNIKRIQKLIQ